MESEPEINQDYPPLGHERFSGACGNHGIEQRQRQGNSGSFEKRATVQVGHNTSSAGCARIRNSLQYSGDRVQSRVFPGDRMRGRNTACRDVSGLSTISAMPAPRHLRTPAAERLLIELLPELEAGKFLCTTLGRGQFAAAAAA